MLFAFFTVFTFVLMAKQVVSETLGSLAQWQAATDGQRSRSALPHTPDGKERALMEHSEWLFVSVFFIFCDLKWGVHCLVGRHVCPVCTAHWTSSFSCWSTSLLDRTDANPSFPLGVSRHFLENEPSEPIPSRKTTARICCQWSKMSFSAKIGTWENLYSPSWTWQLPCICRLSWPNMWWC